MKRQNPAANLATSTGLCSQPKKLKTETPQTADSQTVVENDGDKASTMTSKLPTPPSLALVNGTALAEVTIPQIGFGTYKLKRDAVKVPLRLALEAGYSLIDTASVYENEKEIGATIKGWDRSQIFVSTKLWRSHQGSPAIVEKYINQSLRKLEVEYLDLLMLHWPGPGEHRFKRYKVPQDWTPSMRLETWKAMVGSMRAGKVRSVGVSNFTIRHLEELKKISDVKPAVNQVEMHPFLVQKDLLEYCQREGIRIMAYGSLGQGCSLRLLDQRVVREIADKIEKSPAQVLLRWGVEKGMIVIPCSTQKGHIEENLDIWDFSLGAANMSALDGLHVGRRWGWKGVDPETVP
ncbi:hypothetical protein HK104_006304 [Borealophlyctis nickersoniae]|nr:hypothetical protein HK104_006304 [Borealophlyctis nickersoniae]